MRPVRLPPECLQCLAAKKLPAFLDEQPFEKKLEYMQRILKLLSEASPTLAAPVLVSEINAISREMFNYEPDFEAVKQQYNQLMLTKEEALWERIQKADDPLLAAVQYSLTGNYIDFGAQSSLPSPKRIR